MTNSDGQDIENAIREILAQNARRKQAEGREDSPEADTMNAADGAESAATAAPAAGQAPAGDPELLAEVEALRAERDDLKDKFMRALAEAENSRKRSERDRREAQQYGGSRLSRDLLPVYDALQRALSSVTDEMRQSHDALIEGVELTLRELKNVFSRHGVQTIEPAPGEKFDPQKHEAMFEAAVPGTRSGEIIQVMAVGFTLHDRLLRPAQVGVSSTPAN
jgi:molecular chaperone GrpE